MLNSNHSVPLKVIIGKRHDKCLIFNDDDACMKSYKGPNKIETIRIYYDRDFVYGIDIIFRFFNGEHLLASHNKKESTFFNPITTGSFVIDDDDFLVEISGRSGDWIDRLTFKT